MTMDDVRNMSDEDKLAHVTGYEGSNMSVSTLHPHIVLIDGDNDSVAYNILTGEVTDLAAVNIELIHTVNGETKEVWSFGASEIDEGVRIITADVGDGIYDADKMELHPNGNSHLRFVKSLGSDLKPIGAFSLDGAAFGGVGNYWVFYQEYKGNRTFVVYLDSDGKFQYALFRIDPKQFMSRTIFSG